MATARRLSDDDVKAVFDCITFNKLPSPTLPFKIIPVESDGLRLSPPSHDFEDGLYILLKPIKNMTMKHALKKYVPPNLASLVTIEYNTRKNCPWSLSGPQFPHPISFQQRYCYPKGNPVYSDRKGGAQNVQQIKVILQQKVLQREESPMCPLS